MTGTTCPGDLLWEMLQSELSPQEWSSLEHHIRACPRCQAALVALQRASEFPGGVPLSEARPIGADAPPEPGSPTDGTAGAAPASPSREGSAASLDVVPAAEDDPPDGVTTVFLGEDSVGPATPSRPDGAPTAEPAEQAGSLGRPAAAVVAEAGSSGADPTAGEAGSPDANPAPNASPAPPSAPRGVAAPPTLPAAYAASARPAPPPPAAAPSRRRLRRLAIVAVALVAVAAAFAAAPVRSRAAAFLQGFRVYEVHAVPVDPARLQGALNLAGHIDEVVKIETVDGIPMDDAQVEPVPVADLAAAQGLVPFHLRRPASLPAPVAVRMEPGGDLQLRVDGAALQQLARAAGLETAGVPAEAADVEVRADPGVAMMLDAPRGAAVLTAVPVPEVRVPPGWDLEAIGRLYLAALGMSPGEARALAATIDWGSTLVVPVPIGEVSAVDVKVDGVSGIAFEANRAGDLRRTTLAGGDLDGVARRDDTFGAIPSDAPFVVWQKEGVLYSLAGDVPVTDLVAIANDLK